MPDGLLRKLMKLAAECEADFDDRASMQVAAVLMALVCAIELGKTSDLCNHTEGFFRDVLLPPRSRT
jgi:hypothetical protein